MSFDMASAALDYDEDVDSVADEATRAADLLASALRDAQVGLDNVDGNGDVEETEDNEEEEDEEETQNDEHEEDEADDTPTFHKG
jgi:hypothetical protein